MKKAIDISKHQDTFDAQAAKAQGINMVICRCAYAASKDVRWDAFAPAVKAAGMELAAYGFLTAHYKSKNGGSFAQAQMLMRQQVSTWIGLCTQQGCKTLAVDEELEPPNTMGLTKADNTSLLIEACQMIEAAGIKPLIYCSASWAQGRIDTTRCKYPLWIAYYYADPNDPDFDGCKTLEQVNTGYSRYMLSLGDQLYGWQFGRIGYGAKYGVGSANVDKNFIYKEDKPMAFEPITGKQLRCTSAANPKCETFSAPDTNASLGALELDQVCEITAKGGTVEIAGMIGTWYKIIHNGAEVYCLELPDGRCVIEDVPEEPDADLGAVLEAIESANAKLAEVLAALARLEAGQTAIMDRLNAIFK